MSANDAATTAINHFALALQSASASLGITEHALTREARRADAMRNAVMAIIVAADSDGQEMIADIGRCAIRRDSELVSNRLADISIDEPPQEKETP